VANVQEPGKPANEAARLEALRSLEILDSLHEEAFDQLTELAANMCGTPMALISLVDSERQWFKSRVGIEVDELPRSTSFCGHGILGEGIFEVPDTTQDERFSDNPLVSDQPELRFYAGAPLETPEHYNLGMLCVLDRVPRVLNEDQRANLARLAGIAVHLMQIRRQAMGQARETAYLNATLADVGVPVLALDAYGRIVRANREATELLNGEELDLTQRSLATLLDASDEPGIAEWERLLLDARQRRDGGGARFARRVLRSGDGTAIPVRMAVSPIRMGSEEILGFIVAAHDLRDVDASEQLLSDTLRKQARRRALEVDLLAVQTSFIAQPDTLAAFDDLLAVLLKHSDSEYGFIGEVLRDQDGAPFLKTHALTNIAWTDELNAFFEAHAPDGLEFRNLNTLFGAVMTSGEPVITNDPYHDPRRGGLPDGHPPMNAFLGLPIRSGDSLIGMLGMANRPGGYDESMVDELAPATVAYANLILARKHRLSRLSAEAELREERERLGRAIAGGGLGHWEVDPVTGHVSGNWAEALRLKEAESADPTPFSAAIREYLHPDDQASIERTFTGVLEGLQTDFDLEGRLLNADGEWRWVRIRGARRLGAEGTAYLSGTVEDVHEKHIIQEQSLQLSRNKMLLQEVHHRVKNNLQVISGLLSMQESRSTSPDVAEQLATSRNRVSAVADLHELLYRSGEWDTIDYGKVVEELPKRVFAAFERSGSPVRLESRPRTLPVSFDQSGSLSLILNELVSNALKHGFPEGRTGVIRVTCGPGPSDGQGFLEVQDDGVGFSEADLAAAPARGGIGRNLIRRLTSQVGGTLTRLPSDVGTHWHLTFPTFP
jgi:PAS domain S-box-containing protein